MKTENDTPVRMRFKTRGPGAYCFLTDYDGRDYFAPVDELQGGLQLNSLKPGDELTAVPFEAARGWRVRNVWREETR